MFQNNHYVLLTKDRPILSFRCERDPNGAPVFIQEKEFDVLRPYGFVNIGTWIENRRAPKHRAHIKELLKKCGCDDLEGFIRFAYCAGLNDTFWVKPEELDLSWNDISLYRNEFDESIARLSFGTGLMGEEFSSTTPELATDGTFPKCWKRFKNEIYLLKQGSSGALNAGREPFSEIYAYMLSKEICDNALPYDIIRYHGEIASRCHLFTSEKIGFTPALSFLNKSADIDKMLHFFDEIGSGDEFRQMIVLDALTLNTDRHLKNFGLLYDNDTMKITGMAPVFDNNLSLCPYAEIDDLKNIEAYMATRQSAIGDGFNESAIKCLTPDLKERLLNIRTFNFSDTKISLPEERIHLLESLIHKQAENILNEKIIEIPSQKSENVELISLIVSVNINKVPADTLSELMAGKAKISNFDIVTKSNDVLHINNCEYMVNEFNDRVEIDIYSCQTDGKTESLEIEELRGIQFIGAHAGNLPNATLELQLNKGENSHVTTLKCTDIEIANVLEKIADTQEPTQQRTISEIISDAKEKYKTAKSKSRKVSTAPGENEHPSENDR